MAQARRFDYVPLQLRQLGGRYIQPGLRLEPLLYRGRRDVQGASHYLPGRHRVRCQLRSGEPDFQVYNRLSSAHAAHIIQ